MSKTATEFKENLGKYLQLAMTEDIIISKNGKPVARLTNPYENRVKDMVSLFGILPPGTDADKERAERLEEI